MSLPDVGAFVGEPLDKEINEGANLGLGETSRRIDRVDAQDLDRQARNGLFDLALLKTTKTQALVRIDALGIDLESTVKLLDSLGVFLLLKIEKVMILDMQ